MAVVTISTCISFDEKKKIEREKWKVPELIRLGIKAKENNPQLIARINELETLKTELVQKVQRYAKRLYQIELERDQKKEAENVKVS